MWFLVAIESGGKLEFTMMKFMFSQRKLVAA